MLAEVFTSFRRKAMRYYELDPIHFVTSAELTWNAGKRHDKANNPYVVETYNEKKPHNYIVALDANNLYGYVMSQPLPIGNFRG
ncbi:uncharacterized protein TNCV_1578941 [Trichonephila clavipes]|nr:uncharacterized protein TNCV_1578941 [Trichonephila clavipes]